MRQQTRSRTSARDWARGQFGLSKSLTAGAGHTWPHDPLHHKVAGDIFQLFGDILAEWLERATAIAALGSVPTRKSLIAIAKAAHDDTRQVRFAALKVLSHIHNSTAYIVLLRLVGDPDRKIKADAKRALVIGRVNHTQKFKAALIRVIKSPKHPGSADACDLAEFPDDPEIIKTLRKAARSKRPGVRASAIRMLDELGKQ